MSRLRPLHDFALAVTLLTIVPLRVRAPEADDRSDVASYFPVVGLVVGSAMTAVVVLAARYFYGLSFMVAALVLVAVAAFTRMLHWDGLADVADAWFVAPQHRLDVMKDSNVGAFGATAIALTALVQIGALISLGATVSGAGLVVLTPVFGRLAASFSAWLGKPAREGGLGRSVLARPTIVGVLVALAACAVSIAVPLWLGASVLVVGILAIAALMAALVVPHLIAERFGGVTGDTMGASVVVVETMMLVLSVLVLAGLRLAGWSA